jgi:hypothetical protein
VSVTVAPAPASDELVDRRSRRSRCLHGSSQPACSWHQPHPHRGRAIRAAAPPLGWPTPPRHSTPRRFKYSPQGEANPVNLDRCMPLPPRFTPARSHEPRPVADHQEGGRTVCAEAPALPSRLHRPGQVQSTPWPSPVPPQHP